MMRAILPLLLGLVFGSTALANPCVLPGQFQPVGSGIGGTGHFDDGSGMGGTGSQSGDGGMGGTGHQDGNGKGGTGTRAEGSGKGGTGVVGIITGFGSICVNGIELHYDGATPVLVDGEKKTPDHLAIGQLVAVEAEGQGQSMKARQIAVNSMLAGPVSWVSPSGSSFVALGQTVHLDPAAMPGKSAKAWRPRVGDHVRVNGLPESSGVIRATSVERIAASGRVSLQGRVDSAGAGVARIGGQVVAGARQARAGDYVRVSGRLVDGVLKAGRVESASGIGVSPRAGRVVLQGIAHTVKESGRLSLGYADVRMPRGIASEHLAKPGDLLRVEAQRRPDGMLEVRGFVLDRPARDVVTRPARDSRPRAGEDVERPGHLERDHEERPERAGREDHERVEKPERKGREDAIEKIERPEHSHRRPEIERPELPERLERPETPERIELPERPEVPELPERHDD